MPGASERDPRIARDLPAADDDQRVVGNPGEFIADTLTPVVVLGVAPLTAPGAQAPEDCDLSGARCRWVSGRFGWGLLATCGALSILTSVGIVIILIQEAIIFFGKVAVNEFLFGTHWSALFENPQFGVRPLVGGTLVITLIAML